MFDLAFAPIDGHTAQAGDTGQSGDTAATALDRQQARKATTISLIQGRQHAIDGPMLLGQIAVGDAVGRSYTHSDECVAVSI